jgi:hypothetical protein
MNANTQETAWKNLDRIVARAANGVVSKQDTPKDCEDLDRLATKALGVFQENGVYAGLLFLLSRKQQDERRHAEKVRDAILDMLKDGMLAALEVKPKGDMTTAEGILEYAANTLAADLDRLLLVKSLCEQTLIYVRYAAKAKEYELKLRGKGGG